MRLLRSLTLPREIRKHLRLARGERVLAHALSVEGALVATTDALHLPDGHAVPWQHIDRARWSDEGLHFTEEGAGERFFAVDEPGRLAETIHERVTATIVVSRHVPFAEGSTAAQGASVEGGDAVGFRLVARRPPGGSDITWQVHIDEGVDPGDPRLEEQVPTALAALREQMGV
ncbi:hypothetical protein [Allosalinactinospora lopnorensis]|uniref:hypothetical protein n=1 Tax=Allosalinactinospora lopnorensis TaxID=1352348 RepID=UPI000623F95C|nr:hypothetical protein [Allosalinactinospora lopnorensis]